MIRKWFDNEAVEVNPSENIAWLRIFPFLLLHAGCLLVFYVGASWAAVLTALFLYWLRVFSIGAFYHRYFSHHAYHTNRFWQCLFAILGASSAQRGPIWWAAHHRQHHLVSDTESDQHSPVTNSFLRSHMGWFLCHKNFHYPSSRVQDWLKYPELRWIDRYDAIIPLSLLIILFLIGGLQMVVWGFCISTVLTLHTTLAINSLGHRFGRRRYETQDQSRNNFILALLTLGEGWHNNHHRYPVSVRQGFYWWEVDMTYYILKLFEKMRIISNLKPVPLHIRDNK